MSISFIRPIAFAGMAPFHRTVHCATTIPSALRLAIIFPSDYISVPAYNYSRASILEIQKIKTLNPENTCLELTKSFGNTFQQMDALGVNKLLIAGWVIHRVDSGSRWSPLNYEKVFVRRW